MNETWEDFQKQVNEFITMTQDARALSERCIDYRDGKQWTDEEVKKLRKRKQSPIVNNRIKVKVNGLLGLVVSRKTDPRAYPRTEKHANAADAFTDGLRYCSDKSKYQDVKMEFCDNFFCAGYGAALVGAKQNNDGTIDPFVEHIAWDRVYFDPYSIRKDYEDAAYKGIQTWLDEDKIKLLYPNSDTTQLQTDNAADAFSDKPQWCASGERKRYRVAQHFYLKDGKWWECHFAQGSFLIEPRESPWTDDEGVACCPLEIQAAYKDRDNNAYSEIAAFLDLQDEINHRRSKGLFLLSQRQTFGNKGAIGDVQEVKRELAKPDGHVTVGTGEFGKDFGILPTGDMAKAQFDLLQEAKAEIDAQSFNAQMSGDRQAGDLSGKAIQKLQQAGVTELNALFQSINAWELRIYRQMWGRIRQFWDREKWVRVTDDEDNMRWVGFNSEVTLGDFLNETMDDDSLPKETRLGASAQLIMLEQSNPEALKQLVEVRNPVAEIDLDIILDQSFDTVNVQQEQFEMLVQYGAQAGIDLLDILSVSSFRNKDDLIEKIEKRRKDASEAAGGAQQMAAQKAQADTQKTASDALLNQQKAQQVGVETQLMTAAPSQPLVTV